MTRPTAITNAADASIVKGMILRGDAIHDVAAWFGINSGRIANVKNARAEGAKWKDVPPAPAHSLPPPGPYSYFTSRPGATLAEQLQQALASQDLKWAQALAEIREELRTSAHERRQTNEKLDMLIRQNLETRRALKVVENPAAPKPTLRNPRT
jgi:hypothetical protein